MISGLVTAHDLNPPDWAGSGNSVYALWEFSIAGYGNPDGLADDYNGPGPAYLVSNDPCGWTYSYASHQGVLLPGEARFFLENYTRDNARKKRIRVQATYYGTAPDIESETDDGETPVVSIPPATIGGPIQTYDLGGGWYHGTWEFDYDSTNPGAETVTITGGYLDDVVIDTICYEGTDPNAGPGRKRTLGITEVFAGVITVERRCAMPYIMPEDGTIESISMYHNAMGYGNVRFGVYTGQELPEPRIAQAWGTAIDYGEGWQTVNLIDPVFVEAGTNVWLAWLYEHNPGIRYLDVDNCPGRAATFPKQTWSDERMPDPFGSSVRDGRIHSIYATYTPSGGTPDVAPPAPNPAQWASVPAADGFYSIAMTAMTATDATGVQYYFEETTGNPGAEDSGWREYPDYTDYDLAPDTQYTYRVKTRDYSLLQNESVWSSPASATTDAYPTVGCPDGDLDGNCEVTMEDLLIFVEQWLDDPACDEHPHDCADLNKDTDINSQDFAVIAANWGNVGISRPLVINEFMASNDATIADEHGEYDDWIEIYNMTYYPIDMSGMYIADTTNIWQVPAGITISPHDYKIFWADDGWLTGEGDYHTNFKLSRDSDKITLYDANSVVIDSISWTKRQETDESYGRFPDGTDNWYVMGRDNTTPGLTNEMGRAGAVYFSRPSSTFTPETFSLTLTTRSPNATIYYTNNGSEPTTGGIEYTGSPVTIGGSGRIRARAYEPNLAPGPVVGENYMRVQVPGFQTNLPIVLIDTLGFDIDEHESDRNNHPVVATFIDPDPITGIAGITDPPAWIGYGGMHVRGSSSAGYEKKQYKFETWDEYDQDKNVSLLGMPAESDWIIHGPYSDKTLMRNHLMYTWNRETGRYGVRCRFVEFFLDVNGGTLTQYDYRGVYVFMEKIKRDKNRIDITELLPFDDSEPQITGGYLLKKDRRDAGEVEFRTDYYGDSLVYETDDVTSTQIDWLEDWFYEFELGLASGNFNNPAHANYYGNYIDILSFIDHHILVEISKNVDGFLLSTFLFKDRLGKLNMGPVWDCNGSLGGADYVCNWDPVGWLYEAHDEVCCTDWCCEIDSCWRYGCEGNVLPKRYAWYNRLFQDTEFRLKYADRWYELREYDFSTEKMLADVNDNTDILTTDVGGSTPVSRNFTKWDVLDWDLWPNYYDNCNAYGATYLSYVNWMRNWIEDRLAWMDGAIDTQYGDTPPVIKVNGVNKNRGEHITTSDSISITKTGGGTIYYTTNGSDPRTHGGGIAGVPYSGSFTRGATTQIKARIRYNSSNWSALNEATFAVGPVAENLRITEIMYNVNDPNHEYIELKNISGSTTIQLNLVKFTDGIDFTFPSTSLTAGSYCVVVRNAASFALRYPSFSGLIAGEFVGAINNAGERIELVDALGAVIHNFRFKDGWYPITDGADFSLNIIDPTNPDPNSWEYAEYWQPSSVAGGTPSDSDTGHVASPGDIVINEVMAHSNVSPDDWIELHNTTGSTINISGWFLSDNDNNFKKYEIPSTSILAGGYVVFTEQDHFGTGSGDQFAFSELGDTAYLCSGSGGELAGGFCAKEDFKASEDGVSFGRYTKSAAAGYDVDFVSMSSTTYEAENTTGAKVGPVVITEIMYHPASNNYAEYVELKNISGTTVVLDDWRLIDETGGIEYYIPSGTSLTAGAYLLLTKNEVALNEDFTPTGTILEWFEGRLSNAGEKIELSKPGTPEPSGFVPYIRVDRVNYSDGSHGENFRELGYNDPWPTTPDGTGQALGRITDGNYGNDVANWTAATPTPGS